MNSSTWQAVLRIAADVLNVPLDSLSQDSSPETVDTWDSVQHLSLVLALEEHFAVQIDPEEFEKMKSLEAITLLVESKQPAQQ